MYGFESFYFLFFLLYLLYGILIDSNIVGKKVKIMVLFLPLFLLAALRGDTVGGDLSNYLPVFDAASHVTKFKHLMWISNTEPGLKILDYIINQFSSTHRAFLICTSIISLIGPAYLIYRYSRNPLFSILLYYSLGFYTNTFNNVRQAIAMSICFFAVPYIFDRKVWKFLIIALFAFCFHYSALIFFGLYPIVRYVHNLKSIFVLFFGGVLLFWGSKHIIMEFIANSMLVRYNPESILDSTGGWGLFVLYLLILVVEILLYYIKISKLNVTIKQRALFFISLQSLSVIIQMYATMWGSMTRATHYFFILGILAIPFFISLYKEKEQKIYYAFILILTMFFMSKVYSYNQNTRSNSQGVIPYVFLDVQLF